MKRLLKHDHYRLSDGEKNEIWRAVGGDPGGIRPRRRAFAPAFAFGLTAAAACLAVVWWAGLHEPVVPEAARGPQPETRVVAKVGEPRPAAPQADRAAGTTAALPPQVAADAAGPAAERKAPVAAEAAPQALSAETETFVAMTTPPQVAVGGRIYDKESGEALSQAAVTLAGTDRGVLSDSNGLFRIDGVAPGDSVALQIRYLGYDPVDVTIAAPDTGLGTVEVAMASKIVETLQSFEVEGAEYMVERQERGQRAQGHRRDLREVRHRQRGRCRAPEAGRRRQARRPT